MRGAGEVGKGLSAKQDSGFSHPGQNTIQEHLPPFSPLIVKLTKHDM